MPNEVTRADRTVSVAVCDSLKLKVSKGDNQALQIIPNDAFSQIKSRAMLMRRVQGAMAARYLIRKSIDALAPANVNAGQAAQPSGQRPDFMRALDEAECLIQRAGFYAQTAVGKNKKLLDRHGEIKNFLKEKVARVLTDNAQSVRESVLEDLLKLDAALGSFVQSGLDEAVTRLQKGYQSKKTDLWTDDFLTCAVFDRNLTRESLKKAFPEPSGQRLSAEHLPSEPRKNSTMKDYPRLLVKYLNEGEFLEWTSVLNNVLREKLRPVGETPADKKEAGTHAVQPAGGRSEPDEGTTAAKTELLPVVTLEDILARYRSSNNPQCAPCDDLSSLRTALVRFASGDFDEAKRIVDVLTRNVDSDQNGENVAGAGPLDWLAQNMVEHVSGFFAHDSLQMNSSSPDCLVEALFAKGFDRVECSAFLTTVRRTLLSSIGSLLPETQGAEEENEVKCDIVRYCLQGEGFDDNGSRMAAGSESSEAGKKVRSMLDAFFTYRKHLNKWALSGRDNSPTADFWVSPLDEFELVFGGAQLVLEHRIYKKLKDLNDIPKQKGSPESEALESQKKELQNKLERLKTTRCHLIARVQARELKIVEQPGPAVAGAQAEGGPAAGGPAEGGPAEGGPAEGGPAAGGGGAAGDGLGLGRWSDAGSVSSLPGATANHAQAGNPVQGGEGSADPDSKELEDALAQQLDPSRIEELAALINSPDFKQQLQAWLADQSSASEFRIPLTHRQSESQQPDAKKAGRAPNAQPSRGNANGVTGHFPSGNASGPTAESVEPAACTSPGDAGGQRRGVGGQGQGRGLTGPSAVPPEAMNYQGRSPGQVLAACLFLPSENNGSSDEIAPIAYHGSITQKLKGVVDGFFQKLIEVLKQLNFEYRVECRLDREGEGGLSLVLRKNPTAVGS